MRGKIENSIKACVADAQKKLLNAGIDTASLDAQLLLAHSLNVSREHLWAYPEQNLTEEQEIQFQAMLQRRVKREPVAYILGSKEFYSHHFSVSSDVLIPRPDSEMLVDAVRHSLDSSLSDVRIVDFGVGSGCLLLSLLHACPTVQGLGVDVAAAALVVAAHNAVALGVSERVQWLESDWDAQWPSDWGVVDVMISNPPYIDVSDRAALEPELNYEPEGALTAENHGLAAYEALALVAQRRLKKQGLLFLELGAGQMEDVSRIMVNAGHEVKDVVRDLAGHERVLIVKCN